MKLTLCDLSLMFSRLDHRHVRIGLALMGLVLFVLGAGAPGDGCGAFGCQ